MCCYGLLHSGMNLSHFVDIFLWIKVSLSFASEHSLKTSIMLLFITCFPLFNTWLTCHSAGAEVIFCISEHSANDWLPDQEEIPFTYSLDFCGKVLVAGGTAGGVSGSLQEKPRSCPMLENSQFQLAPKGTHHRPKLSQYVTLLILLWAHV